MDVPVLIIGAGPAGISAAVQLKRYNIESIIFEKDSIGGLVRNAYLIENTMFYPSGLSGAKFAEILKNYAKKYKLNVLYEEVTEVNKENEYFEVITNKNTYNGKYLILATGSKPKTLPYPWIKYHITELDKEKYENVVIIGGGDIALDYSLSLSEISKEVIVLHRSEIKANMALQNMVKNRKNIVLIEDSLKRVIKKQNKFIIETNSKKLEADEILGAIGRIPNVDLVKNIKSPRLYIIGDAKNGIYRYSSLAIGDGIKTATEIWRWEKYGNPRRNR